MKMKTSVVSLANHEKKLCFLLAYFSSRINMLAQYEKDFRKNFNLVSRIFPLSLKKQPGYEVVSF